MSKWIAEFDLEDGDTMSEHMDLNYMGAKIDFHCRPMWIPVSERLPKSSGVYIVTREFNDGFECADLTDACYFDGTSTWHNDNRINHGREYVDKKIKAWMPLPEPYKAEIEQGMNCEDCVYSDIADWEQNEKTGKAKAVYWCERHKKLCNDIQKCQIEDNGEK